MSTLTNRISLHCISTTNWGLIIRLFYPSKIFITFQKKIYILPLFNITEGLHPNSYFPAFLRWGLSDQIFSKPSAADVPQLFEGLPLTVPYSPSCCSPLSWRYRCIWAYRHIQPCRPAPRSRTWTSFLVILAKTCWSLCGWVRFISSSQSEGKSPQRTDDVIFHALACGLKWRLIGGSSSRRDQGQSLWSHDSCVSGAESVEKGANKASKLHLVRTFICQRKKKSDIDIFIEIKFYSSSNDSR